MCNQLFQYYACGHSNSICLTPCPHALETGTKIPINNGGTDLSRTGSTVSSISPITRRSDTADLPSQSRSPLSYTGPSRVHAAPALPPRSTSSHAPAAIGPPPGCPSPITTAPPIPATRWSIHNPDPPRPASPVTPALPDEDFTIEPNFCPYHFKRDLPQSNHPCIECYFLPKWAHLADRYVKSYREGHPLNKHDEAERMSGMERMRQEKRQGQGVGEVGREGLLNVFVHGEGVVGRAA